MQAGGECAKQKHGSCREEQPCDPRRTAGPVPPPPVRSSMRRSGIATRLMQAAEEGLVQLGCPKVNLQVRSTNAEVIAFYRAIGYEIEERVSMGKRLRGEG